MEFSQQDRQLLCACWPRGRRYQIWVGQGGLLHLAFCLLLLSSPSSSFLHLLWAEPNRLQVVILPLSTLSLFAVCTMVCPTSISRICTILLVVYTAQASQTLVRRTVDGIQLEAARRTHSLATDLRIAFSGILPRAVSPSSQPRNVVYCKPAKQVPVSVGPGGATVTHGNATSTVGTGTVTRTRTTGRSTATKTSLSPSPTATSPWNLLESHVSYPQVYIYRCSNFVDVTEWNHILRRLGLRHLCRSNAWFVQPFSLDNPPIHDSLSQVLSTSLIRMQR